MSVPFHQTRLGQSFFDKQLPDLVRTLERIAGAMERIADRLDSKAPEPADHPVQPARGDER